MLKASEPPIVFNKEKEIKISECIEDYIKRQKKSYLVESQNDLYYLMHDFGKIIKKLDGKPVNSTVSREEKLLSLAKIQCEAYYSLGILDQKR